MPDDTCPKCGAPGERYKPSGSWNYECGTTITRSGVLMTFIDHVGYVDGESQDCLRRQLAQAKVRIAELEAACASALASLCIMRMPRLDSNVAGNETIVATTISGLQTVLDAALAAKEAKP